MFWDRNYFDISYEIKRWTPLVENRVALNEATEDDIMILLETKFISNGAEHFRNEESPGSWSYTSIVGLFKCYTNRKSTIETVSSKFRKLSKDEAIMLEGRCRTLLLEAAREYGGSPIIERKDQN
jgi:hypothetical protein